MKCTRLKNSEYVLWKDIPNNYGIHFKFHNLNSTVFAVIIYFHCKQTIIKNYYFTFHYNYLGLYCIVNLYYLRATKI